MPNPTLDKDELVKANALLDRIRAEPEELAGGDKERLFAYRRRIAKMLTYDERGGPNKRGKLKAMKRAEQGGLCAACGEPLPPTHNILDSPSRWRAIPRRTPN